MARDNLDEPSAVLRGCVPFRQCFDVSTDRRDRRAKLVGDVGDEVSANLIGAAKVGEVVQDEHGTVDAAGGGRGRPRHNRPRRVARRRQLQRFGRLAGERRRDELGDGRMPNRFDVVAAERQVVELQHVPRRVVCQLQPALWIDDDHPFDHAGEDRFHPRAIARLRGEPAAHFLHRIVQCAGDGAQLVVSIIEPWRREIACAVARGDLRNHVHALADARGHHPADRGRARQREAKGCQGRREDGLQLMPDVGERQGDAHDRNRGMLGRHGRIEHVDFQRVAVPA